MSMRNGISIFLVTFVYLMNAYAQTADKFAAAWEKEHISTIFPSDVRHADLKKYLDQIKKLGIAVNEVSRSGGSREIYQVEWGRGPLKIFMWSQMHGDEPTATSALIDMFAFLQKHRDKDWVKRIGDAMTIRAVPMLNPDGADAYKRRNLQDIDINRDALDLKTPEAQLLKRLRDDWNPAIGFNLHNQQSLTTAGRSLNQATISLLVVYGDEAKTVDAGQERNTRVIAGIVAALQKFIPGHIARYSDEWTPTAFGDNFSTWGTPTILIETGALYGKDEMFLVKINFVAFMTALESIATGAERTQDTAPYLTLPENSSGNLVNFIFRNVNLVADPLAPEAPAVADIAAVTERRRASFVAPARITNVGSIGGLHGLEEYNAGNFIVVQRLGVLHAGELAELSFYKKDRTIDWANPEREKQFPPDAIFSAGKWIKGEGLVPRIR